MASYKRAKIVNQAQAWVGLKESDNSHQEIIDVYNSHTPLARGYKVQYTDAWCATFVSAVSIKCGYTAIIPTECGCDKMIELFKSLGEWEEDDSYKPTKGDIIFYDWQDTTGSSSDNTGGADHVGIVEKVSGTTITVIEGNYNDAVGRRTIQVNGQYIRGYGVPKYADSTSTTTTTTKTITAAKTTSAKPETIWNYLYSKIGNAYGVAGLMGNLYAESSLKSCNLQNTYESKLGYTDDTYTDAVDNETYSNFASDSAGYGLAQWTFSTRKKNLLAYADSKQASIGNLEMQLEFLLKELSESYQGVLGTLCTATTVLEASNAVLTKFEQPADQGSSVQSKRASYGQNYYNQYAPKTSTTTTEKKASETAASKDDSLKGTYTVSAKSGLNVRDGAGASKTKLVAIPYGTSVQCYGYYTTAESVKWLYIQFTYQDVKYTGFASKNYLAKV